MALGTTQAAATAARCGRCWSSRSRAKCWRPPVAPNSNQRRACWSCLRMPTPASAARISVCIRVRIIVHMHQSSEVTVAATAEATAAAVAATATMARWWCCAVCRWRRRLCRPTMRQALALPSEPLAQGPRAWRRGLLALPQLPTQAGMASPALPQLLTLVVAGLASLPCLQARMLLMLMLPPLPPLRLRQRRVLLRTTRLCCGTLRTATRGTFCRWAWPAVQMHVVHLRTAHLRAAHQKETAAVLLTAPPAQQAAASADAVLGRLVARPPLLLRRLLCRRWQPLRPPMRLYQRLHQRLYQRPHQRCQLRQQQQRWRLVAFSKAEHHLRMPVTWARAAAAAKGQQLSTTAQTRKGAATAAEVPGPWLWRRRRTKTAHV
mmetsp:Transcript_32128/g.95964  ORF Transcript_32128/g.95964 Transcript_32128/m.95964 type:complete len:378 (+) Transcript_32128:638-1771(+)